MIQLKPDTVNAVSVKWFDGDTDLFKTFSVGGIYSVQAIDVFGCTASDSVVVVYEQAPIISMANDTAICAGELVDLRASLSGEGRVEWSTGGTDTVITTSEAGKYILIAYSQLNCIAKDSIDVKIYNYPVVDLTPDTIVCFDDGRVSLQVNADSSNYSYQWGNGTTLSTLVIDGVGVYSVDVSSDLGCVTPAEVTVAEYCPWTIYIPNTFTPNGDGKNEFLDVRYCDYKAFVQLKIAALLHSPYPAVAELGKELQKRAANFKDNDPLVMGGNWFDEHYEQFFGVALKGIYSKTFLHPDSAHSTVGFRYVVRMKNNATVPKRDSENKELNTIDIFKELQYAGFNMDSAIDINALQQYDKITFNNQNVDALIKAERKRNSSSVLDGQYIMEYRSNRQGAKTLEFSPSTILSY